MYKAWLLRPNPHENFRLEEFKSENIIAVGWPGIGDLTNKSREDIKSLLQENPYNYASLVLGNAYATIDILVNQMDLDDLVLIPNGDDIYFAKITSNYKYDNSKDNDEEGYPHQRKVKFLNSPISRSSLPNELRNSLKVRRAAANLTKHYNLIKDLSEGNEITSLNTVNDNNNFIDVEYPIRSNTVIQLRIPNDLTQNEAIRLSDFVKTLYFN